MSKPITIELTFTESQWAEIANALVNKLQAVERGDYGPEDSPGGDRHWVADLQTVAETLVAKIEEKGLVW